MLPNRIKISRKKLLLCSVFFLFFALILLFLTAPRRAQNRWLSLSEELFHAELTDNALNLHYTLAYPENYGFSGPATLPVYTGKTDPDEERDAILSTLKDLSRIQTKYLDERDAYTVKLLIKQYQNQLKALSYPYFSEPFSPGSGIQSGLPILLADYTFRRKEDVETYLSILAQSEAYLGGLLTYEAEKADAGLFMPSYSAEKVISQCSAIMDRTALENGTHFLHETFQERLQVLLEKGAVTRREFDYYLSENDRLLTCVMAPAYEQVADAFTLLSDKSQGSGALCSYPKGKDYYAHLLTTNIGTDRSVSEIKQLLYEDFKQNYADLFLLLEKTPELSDSSPSALPDLSLSAPTEIIDTLRALMAKDFPPFPSASPSLDTSPGSSSETSPNSSSGTDLRPMLALKTVAPSMEDYSAPAYYLIPPMDDLSQNTIYINQKTTTDNLSLFTTLAHEGYPGHLYQTLYSRLVSLKEKDVPLRNVLHYGGYVEGWAYYVEDISYTYAQKIGSDALTATYAEACRLNRNLHLGMYSLLDIAIHYENASLAQAAKMLELLGITDPDTVKRIYEYIIEEPTNYPKYYVGFLEMKLLKEAARKTWQEEYSAYKFHEFVLTMGPSDFPSLYDALVSG